MDAVGPYHITQLIAKGGQASVYAVTRPPDGGALALKLLSQDVKLTEEARVRFEREIRIGQDIQPPNVVRMMDWGTHEGRLYLVMERLQGSDLAELLRLHKTLPLPHVKNIVAQILHGLHALHWYGVVHRDLKPENIFVCADGVVKLMDLGLAGLDRASLHVPSELMMKQPTHGFLGTMGYVAPEQFGDAHLADHRSDLFTVGLVAYRCLTGHLPFEDEGIMGIVDTLMGAEPMVPLQRYRMDLPASIQEWLDVALSLDPTCRFQSAAAALNALEAWP